MKFYQTRSNAIILYDTLPAYCMWKASVIKSAETIYQTVYVSPRPPPKISFKDDWTCDLDFVARSSEDIQQIKLKLNIHLSSTGRLVTKWSEGTLERTRFDRDTLNQEKHDEVTDPTNTGDPCVDTNPQNVACWHLNMLRMIKQVRRDPSRWIKKRNTTLISEYQDCHMQLWKKQNISEFKILYNGSKIILIEQHFKPTCSRTTSTIHSAKIRRRWSANWEMWSYSSCAKLHPKYNIPNVFFVGMKELCIALADNAWLTANPEEVSTNTDWMHSLSRTTW